MGTRHLVCVYANKRFQAAQYGQFDGYPGSAGVEVLDFIRGLNPKALAVFKKKLRNVRLYSSEEFKELNLYDKENYEQPSGSSVLNRIFNSEDKVHLINSVSFSGDSLSCEWAYVLNLDNNTFSVYEGFVEKESESAEIFLKYKQLPAYRTTHYYPVKLVASYGLENLPETEDFVERFKDEEDE
jgi:hypothetical protein